MTFYIKKVFIFLWLTLSFPLTIQSYQIDFPEDETIYVSEQGFFTNLGLRKDSPAVFIQDAVDLAIKSNKRAVYIHGQPRLDRFVGLTIKNASNLTIVGGWNEDFTIQNDYSLMDGNSNVYHVIMLSNAYNITLDSLMITRGNAFRRNILKTTQQNGYGAGIAGFSLSNCIFNCLVMSNSATNGGGGLFLHDSVYCEISGTFHNNYAGEGGGVFLKRCYNTEIIATVISNRSKEGGGGVYLDYSADCEIPGNILYNRARQDGGGLLLNHSISNLLNGTYSGNISGGGYGGGGAYLLHSDFNQLTGGFTDNSAGYGGGGMVFFESDECIVSGSITGNFADKGGGVYLQGYVNDRGITNASDTNTFTERCTIQNNEAFITGGGIYEEAECDENDWNEAMITGNTPDNIAIEE